MQKEVILITGASGTLAKRLSESLSSEYQLRFLTRNPKNENHFKWSINANYIDEKAFEGVKHIIHLSGCGIADKRWTDSRKKEIYASRSDATRLIGLYLYKKNIKIDTFITASAVGFYGQQISDKIYSEDDLKGKGFLSDVVKKWECSASHLKISGNANRILKLRFGVILSKDAGALKKMMTPIKFNLGSSLGSGKQYMPWIHIDDVVGSIIHLLKSSNEGVFNIVASEHVTNTDFTKQLANVMNKFLFMPNIPESVIKVIFGEASQVILGGSRVSNSKLIKSGYNFKFPDLKSALKDLIN